MTTTTPMTAPPGTGPPDPAVNDQAAMRAEARDQVRHAAAQWLTGDRTAALGQQMVLSITRYRQANQRSPTWAEALAGVDPALWEPITTVPEGWPPAVWRRDWPPAVWRRELRQRPRPPGTSPPATIRTDQVVLSKPDHRSQGTFLISTPTSNPTGSTEEFGIHDPPPTPRRAPSDLRSTGTTRVV